MVLVLLAPGFAAPVSADENDATKAILDKAIKALGGEDRLAKYRAATWKIKMKTSVAGRVRESTGEEAVQWPGCYRGELLTNGSKYFTILNGEKGWDKDSRGIIEMDEGQMSIQRRKLFSRWIPVVLIPLRDKTFKLETIREENVGGRPAIGIKVTPPDHQVFGLYFNKESNLPVRMRMAAKVKGNTTVWESEEIYSEYKEIQGLKKAMKITVNDLTDESPKLDPVEFEITEFKFAEKLDQGKFSKPQ